MTEDREGGFVEMKATIKTALFLSIAILIALTEFSTANACRSGVEVVLHNIDNDEMLVDTTAPGKVRILDTSIIREDEPPGSLCLGIGSLGFNIEAPSDDRTPTGEMGYIIKHPDGELDKRFTMLSEEGPYRAVDNWIWLNFSDNSANEFSHEFIISAVDLAGNEGEDSDVVLVEHAGNVGCSTASTGKDFGMLSLLLFLMGVCAVRKTRG